MATVSVHALSSGSLTTSDHAFIFPADPTTKRSVPSMSFLIQHQAAGKTTRILFDLGIRRDIGLYPQPLQKHCIGRHPLTTKPDVVQSLAKGGLTPDDIDYIILSHVHWDHIGMPSDFSNPRTIFVVGHGALDLLSGKVVINIGSHSYFENDLLPLERTIELPHPSGSESSNHSQPTNTLNQIWTPLDPFLHVLDLFSDGAVRVIDAPGHLPGHIGLLCSLAPDKYVALVGDACHDQRLLDGIRDIPTWLDEEGNRCCIHYDPDATKETLHRLRKVQLNGMDIEGQKVDVEIVFAHDWAWERDAVARERFWPGRL